MPPKGKRSRWSRKRRSGASKISPQPKNMADPRLEEESETTTDDENDNRPATQNTSPSQKLSLFRDGRSAANGSLEESDAEEEDEEEVEVPKKKMAAGPSTNIDESFNMTNIRTSPGEPRPTKSPAKKATRAVASSKNKRSSNDAPELSANEDGDESDAKTDIIEDEIPSVNSNENESFEDADEFPSFQGALSVSSLEKSSSSLIVDPTVSGLASLKKYSPVWCKYKIHPWWPAIIHSAQYTSAAKKGKKKTPASPMKKLHKASVLFLPISVYHKAAKDSAEDAAAAPKGISVNPKLLKLFNCAEKEEMKDSGRQYLLDRQPEELKNFEQAILEAENVVISLRNGQPIDISAPYLDSSFSERRAKCADIGRNSSSESAADPPENRGGKNSAKVWDEFEFAEHEEDLPELIVRPANDKMKKLGKPEFDEEIDVEDDAEGPSNSAAANRRKSAANSRLIGEIKSDACRDYLVDVFNGKTESARHWDYMKASSRMAAKFPNPKTGPIVDEDEIDAIIDHLLTTFGAICESNAKKINNWTGAKQRDYIVKIWLPEAIKFALAATRRCSLSAAEAKLAETPRISKADRDDLNDYFQKFDTSEQERIAADIRIAENQNGGAASTRNY